MGGEKICGGSLVQRILNLVYICIVVVSSIGRILDYFYKGIYAIPISYDKCESGLLEFRQSLI